MGFRRVPAPTACVLTATVDHTLTAYFSFVALNDGSAPVPAPPLRSCGDEEARRWREANIRRRIRLARPGDLAHVHSTLLEAESGPRELVALLLIAELAYWSLDERAAGRIEPGTTTPRLLGILAVVATGIAAAALVLLASESDVARSPARTAAGFGAILACVAVLGTLTRSRNPPR